MSAAQAATRRRESMSSQLEASGLAGNGRLMRAAGIETVGGEVRMLELAAP